MRALLISMFVYLAATFSASADQFQTKLLASAGLNSDLKSLFPAIKTVTENPAFNLRKVTINEKCSAREVCLFVLDIPKLESGLKRRYARYLDKLEFNMISVAPNTILIDASLIRIQTTALFKNVGLLWQLNEMMPSETRPKDLIAMYASQSRKQAYDMSFIGWEPEIYLGMLAELREFIDTPNKDRVIVLSFGWQLLHELGHIKQFSGASMDDQGPLGFSLMDIPKFFSLAERTRRLESEADAFADHALAAVLAEVREPSEPSQKQSDQELLQESLPEVAVMSSVESWQAFGIARIFSFLSPLRFDDQFLQYLYIDCEDYTQWLTSDNKTLPEVTETPPLVIFGIAEPVVAVSNEVVLVTEQVARLAQSRYTDLKSKGVYSLENERFKGVIRLGSENFFGGLLNTTTSYENKLLSALNEEKFPPVTRDMLGRPTRLKLEDVEREWKKPNDPLISVTTEEAINCSDDLSCKVYTFMYGQEALTMASAIADRASGSIIEVQATAVLTRVINSDGDDIPDDGTDEWRVANVVLAPLLSGSWLLEQIGGIGNLPDKFAPDLPLPSKVLKLYRATVDACNYGTVRLKDSGGHMLSVSSSNPRGVVSYVYKAVADPLPEGKR